jgi:hypothetical protein
MRSGSGWPARGGPRSWGRDLGLYAQALPYLLAGLALAFAISRPLSTLTLGEDVARGLGQRTRLVRVVAGLSVILLAGGCVAVAGPIGFVGLVVPHPARPFGGNRLSLAVAVRRGGWCRAPLACRRRCPRGDLASGATGWGHDGAHRRTVLPLSRDLADCQIDALWPGTAGSRAGAGCATRPALLELVQPAAPPVRDLVRVQRRPAPPARRGSSAR